MTKDGIRALAGLTTLFVVCVHSATGTFSQAVDALFVILGFLLFSHLRGGSGSRQSAKAAACRAGIELLILLAALLLIILALSSRALWIENLRLVVVSALFVQNWWLIFMEVDPFGRANAFGLAQHLWLVSILAQLGLAGALTAAAVRRLGRAGRTRLLPALLAIAILCSFGWWVAMPLGGPDATYFDTVARIWQLGLGGAIALLAARTHAGSGRAFALLAIPRERLDVGKAVPVLPAERGLAAPIASALSWGGILAIAVPDLAMDLTTRPTLLAGAWPVAGAVLVLTFARADCRWNAGKLLSQLPTGIAGLALGIYLWHWPLFAIAAEATQDHTLPLHLAVIVLASAAVAAAAGKKLATFLVLHLDGARRRLPPAAALTGCLFAVAVAAGASERLLRWNDVSLDRLRIIGQGLSPGPLAVRRDLPPRHEECLQSIYDAEVLRCEHGRDDAAGVVVVVGSSTMEQWLPAIEPVADAAGWRLVSMMKAACTFADARDASLSVGEGQDPSCLIWNEAVLREILALRPLAVIATATRPLFGVGGRRGAGHGERIPQGFLAVFSTLTEAGIPVAAFRETPRIGHNVPRCAFSPWIEDPDNCGAPRDEVLDDARFIEEAQRLPAGVGIVDMTDLLCRVDFCGATLGGYLIYRDTHHLSTPAARSLTAAVGDRLHAALLEARSELEGMRSLDPGATGRGH
jgi:peptidoglycan/LPS O-acetylase OafA/YrhL